MVARDATRLDAMLASGLLREVDPEFSERLQAHLGGEAARDETEAGAAGVPAGD